MSQKDGNLHQPIISDADQDFGSNQSEDDDSSNKNMKVPRSREWSPKQYSVSSNDAEEEQNIYADLGEMGVEMKEDYNSSSGGDEPRQSSSAYKEAESHSFQVLREILNEDTRGDHQNDNSESEDDDYADQVKHSSSKKQ